MGGVVLDITRPNAGFYKARLVKGGPWIPVHIWYGPPNDPETGEPLDRSWRWYALVGTDDLRDGVEMWTWCAKNPISADEYRFLRDDRRWLEEHAPDDPEANPYQAVDMMATKPIF